MLKTFLITGLLTSTVFAQAAPWKDLSSYSGPLYRALKGDNVVQSRNGSRSVRFEDKLLILCSPMTPKQEGFHNNYDCQINFDTLRGRAAKAVARALQDQAVVIGVSPYIAKKSDQVCQNDHCVIVRELSCNQQTTCGVESYVSGWDE